MIKKLTILLAGLLVASHPRLANAAAELTLYDGVNPLITVTDNGPGDFIVATGASYVRTNVGVWSLSINSAVTKPVLGSATDPVMSLIILANSTAAGSLRVVFSDTGFGPASGTLKAVMDGHVISGAGTTVTYDVYGDPANVLSATTVHIASTGTTAVPNSPTFATGSGSLTLPAPYSLTQVATIVASGPTTVSMGFSFSIPPPPPVITCPGDIVVTSCSDTPVSYSATVADTCGGNVSVAYTPPSGTLFAPGTTTPVQCIVTDACGGSNSCSFLVTVRPPLLSVALGSTPGTITITWVGGGTLQAADSVLGPWTDLPPATSPYTTAASASQQFYRLHCP